LLEWAMLRIELGFVESKPRDLGNDRGYRRRIRVARLRVSVGRLLYCWDGGCEEIIFD
jgi:hypothetical protein